MNTPRERYAKLPHVPVVTSRRDLLFRAGLGFGGLALTALLGQSDRDLQLGGIQTDKHFAFLRHGSSLVREARRRPIRNNPRSSHRGDEPPPPATNIRSGKWP